MFLCATLGLFLLWLSNFGVSSGFLFILTIVIFLPQPPQESSPKKTFLKFTIWLLTLSIDLFVIAYYGGEWVFRAAFGFVFFFNGFFIAQGPTKLASVCLLTNYVNEHHVLTR